jgi:hypothetical protein
VVGLPMVQLGRGASALHLWYVARGSWARQRPRRAMVGCMVWSRSLSQSISPSPPPPRRRKLVSDCRAA